MSKVKAAAVTFGVRVVHRFIVGFRYIGGSDKPVCAENERLLAPQCIAVLGQGSPYVWNDPVAAQFVAHGIGGTLETLGGREPPEGWDAP